MTGESELDAMIARLRDLPKLARTVAPDCARVVESEIKRTIAAGTDPYGLPWAPKKQGGGKPLAGAAAVLGVAAVGSSIFVRLHGVEARHHMGRVRGRVTREIIPTRDIPPAMAAGMRRVISDAFLKVMSNG